MKHCSKCQEWKEEAEFYSDTRTSDGLRSPCKECYNHSRLTPQCRERNRKYHLEHRESVNERKRLWQAQQNDEYRFRNALRKRLWRAQQNDKYRLRNALRARLWRAQQNDEYRLRNAERQRNRETARKSNGGSFTLEEWVALCNHYGNVCLACGKSEVTIDHIVPISKGGSSNIDNLQPLCGRCNTRKRDEIIDYRSLMHGRGEGERSKSWPGPNGSCG